MLCVDRRQKFPIRSFDSTAETSIVIGRASLTGKAGREESAHNGLFADATLSALHCTIFSEDGCWYVKDHSMHGTVLSYGDKTFHLRSHERIALKDGVVIGLIVTSKGKLDSDKQIDVFRHTKIQLMVVSDHKQKLYLVYLDRAACIGDGERSVRQADIRQAFDEGFDEFEEGGEVFETVDSNNTDSTQLEIREDEGDSDDNEELSLSSESDGADFSDATRPLIEENAEVCVLVEDDDHGEGSFYSNSDDNSSEESDDCGCCSDEPTSSDALKLRLWEEIVAGVVDYEQDQNSDSNSDGDSGSDSSFLKEESESDWHFYTCECNECQEDSDDKAAVLSSTKRKFDVIEEEEISMPAKKLPKFEQTPESSWSQSLKAGAIGAMIGSVATVTVLAAIGQSLDL
ncbi:unnamed protein product [Kuraishia capsulata CBS 1993]|uniref:FHA domain-containing protein n=1 Tax=Kuraishia capsulata CBS 1993 TaxID=1382522 RepID=W6MNY2_9ASCO|nr:uncharacterized protein KUCA_T00004318001 [Kuraishia capsulata CBS 1993]CDK28336.1 unnamed protein product [Kuraishia capsulata CBS 1993]